MILMPDKTLRKTCKIKNRADAGALVLLPNLLLATFAVLAVTSCNAAVVPRDKQLHFAAGAVIYAGTYTAARALDVSYPRAWAMGATIAAGIGKEIYDKHHPLTHTCDPMDAAATVLGGLTVSFVVRF